MFIAGDIGGTSTRLGLYSSKNGFLCVESIKHYKSAEFDSLEDAVKRFLKEHDAVVDALCLGVPGPVRGGCVQLTNLPWEFSEDSLRSSLALSRVKVVNDLFAVAAAVPHLGEADVETLHQGGSVHPNNRIAVLAPGTGLGHASAAKVGEHWEVFCSEGGHIDFAPRDEFSLELLRFLFKKFKKRVSYERVLSGPGLVNMYEFLGTLDLYHEPELTGEDLPRQISEKGISGESQRAAKTLDMFCRILGGLAGNCVLYNMCTGGIYLGGGIPPKILRKLKDGAAQKEYVRQGRMSPIVEDAPLRVITNDQAGMLGSAVLARELSER
ncbi:MAG: glucokinase [Bdellovibrionales bacterium]|nr:glucokinase [Bdellovibrionales bacterium]